MDKKQTLLIILAALFTITLAYRILNPYRQKTVRSLTYTSGHRQTAATKSDPVSAVTANGNADLMMDHLMNPDAQQGRVFRDIFEKKAPDREVKPPVYSDAVPSRETQGGEDTMPPEPEQNGMNQDLAKFTAFGSYESDGARYIFLERNKDILIVRQGDVIDGQYRVENISDHSMTFRSEIQGQSVTIDISDLLP